MTTYSTVILKSAAPPPSYVTAIRRSQHPVLSTIFAMGPYMAITGVVKRCFVCVLFVRVDFFPVGERAEAASAAIRGAARTLTVSTSFWSILKEDFARHLLDVL